MGLRQRPWAEEEEGFYIPSPHGDLVDAAAARRRRRQPRPCLQIRTAPDAGGRRRRHHQNSLSMASSRRRASPIIAAFVGFLLLVSVAAAVSSPAPSNVSFHPREELAKLRRVRAHLRRLNKPSVTTIQSPEGDLIDCVPSHLQPAFDHPLLKEQMPLEPPERPSGLPPVDAAMAVGFQSWAMTGQSCPEGTVPIRRTTEADVLRASSIGRFGRKPVARVRRDSTSSGHEVR